MIDYERVLPIIEFAIDLARRNPKPEGDPMPDNYVAWVICQELRRTGWTIVPAGALDSN
jgi:hypothetical protein